MTERTWATDSMKSVHSEDIMVVANTICSRGNFGIRVNFTLQATGVSIMVNWAMLERRHWQSEHDNTGGCAFAAGTGLFLNCREGSVTHSNHHPTIITFTIGAVRDVSGEGTYNVIVSQPLETYLLACSTQFPCPIAPD